MKSVLLRWALAMSVALVSACGGGSGGSGSGPFGGSGPGGGTGGGTGGSGPSASDLVLVLSANNVANNGTETIVASATALDGNRNTIAGAPVTISVDNGGVATPSGPTSDASGVVTATIGIGSDRTSRTITVTAKSGGLTRTAALEVRESIGGTNTGPSDLVLVLSSPTIVNTGAQRVTATVTALDAKRNVLPGAAVTLTVDANAVIAPSGTSTDTAGVITGSIGIGGDGTNRTITVTATSGTLVRTAQLQVSDTVSTNAPVASDLSLVLSASRLNNGGTSTLTATVTAVDGNRNALAGIPVTIKVDSSAVASVSGTSTNTSGVVTATIGIGADRSNRVVTVTATSGALTRTASFTVDGAVLKASLAPRVNAGSTGNQIEYTLLDTNALPMIGQTVSVTAPGLPSDAGTTDNNGKYVYAYTAPATATSLTFTAAAAGTSQASTVEVGSGTVDPAPAAPLSASITPSPSVVTVNQVGSTTNQVELRALFLGANNQPIPRVRARFDLDGNANSSDGVVAWLGGNYAYSDGAGVARGTFIPGQRSSPTNGVTVRLCYDTVDFDVATCPNPTRATLTVTQEALAVSIRTNELIKEGAAKLTYIKEYVVMVVDAAGQAKADVLITPSVDLPSYYKGFYQWGGTRWVQTRTLASTENYSWNGASRAWAQGAATTQPSCPNEDVNRNGVREAGTFGSTTPALSLREEDLNWNGSLDPRKSDVAIKLVGSAKTDANGLAIVQIEYGKDLATWVDFVITVTASGISGTEARARYSGLLYGLGNLPAPGDAFTNEAIPPAFVVSPYGRSTQCTNPD